MKILIRCFRVFILVTILLNADCIAQVDYVRFEHISIADGLSSNNITDILQDSRSFMWFATDLGLHRWDGYQMKIFYHDPADTNSLSSSGISTIFEDSKNVMWVGTFEQGLNRYNRELENFTRYYIGYGNHAANYQNNILQILEDHNSNLWLATNYGLIKFDRQKGSFERFTVESTSFYREVDIYAVNYITALCEKDMHTLLVGTKSGLVEFDISNEIFIKSPFNKLEEEKFSDEGVYNITDIVKDRSGIFWIATKYNGFYRYEPSKKFIRRFISISNKMGIYNYRGINSICMNEKECLWIGSWNGLYNYDKSDGKFNAFLHKSRDNTSINGSDINKVYLDKDNNLWIGTSNSGINLLPKWQKPFNLIGWNTDNSNSPALGVVKSIYEDDKGDLWIGSWGNGVTFYDAATGEFFHYTTYAPKKFRIPSNYINTIYSDKDGSIWIGSSGMYFIDVKTKSIKIFDELKYRRVRTICSASNGDLWLGFKYTGFARYDRRKDSFKYFFHDNNDSSSLSDDHIICMYEDGSGRLWIGTKFGLNCLVNPLNEHVEFTKYFKDPNNPKSIAHNTITNIFQDSKGRLWFGSENGLDLFSEKENNFIMINIIENNASNVVQKILEDDKENLWIRWGGKLVKYNPDTNLIRVYDARDGFVLSGRPNRWDEVLYRGKSGKIYLGGIDKIVTFDQDKLNDNPNISPVVLTNFLLQNKPAIIGGKSPLKKSITEAKIIKLSYNENILSFEFASLDYTNPTKNKYAYKMKGVDEDWIFTDAERRYVTYTNLDPGEYIFKVKGTNSDGIWNEKGASIKIFILPPWWATWWAYSIYITVFLGLLYLVRRYELNRQNIKHNWELERVETEKYQEIDRMKSHFFANISHEFRTPLTLIKGPIQQMLSGDFTGNVKKQYRMILRNTNRLMQLVNQLLDLSKIDSGQMVFRTSPENIVPLVNGLTQSFESLAKQKNIKLQFFSSENEIIIYIDRDKFEKAIINLLSNAFKFTPEGGNVSVSITPSFYKVSEKNKNIQDERVVNNINYAEIKISNSGEGISPDKLDKIFDRFYQADDSSVRRHEGTGIGLSLTKELVEIHHGKITVESEPNINTTFTINLPSGKEHLLPEEIVDTPDKVLPEFEHDLIASAINTEPETENVSTHLAKNSTTLLIVEDNRDMRNYMCNNLKSNFKIIEAEDGEVGIKKAMNHLPDMIISDVMMPKLDGYQFCHKIKTGERTSHIPVILLTAKASVESKIEGLETGVDDYLTKPFDTRELKVRINNLIEQRRRLQEKFRREISVSPRDITVTSIDEQLVQRAVETVERNISDPEFDTSKMSGEVGVSRMLLNTKLKALTGLSTGEFIRTIRLKRASQLLQKGYGNVTQVAYDVGFKSLSYFAKAFREQFGQSPSHYLTKDMTNKKI